MPALQFCKHLPQGKTGADVSLTDQSRLASFVPNSSMIALFVHILKSPLAPSVQSDIVLMDIASGFLSRLLLATDCTLSLSFITELPQHARAAVRAAEESSLGGISRDVLHTAVRDTTENAGEEHTNLRQDPGLDSHPDANVSSEIGSASPAMNKPSPCCFSIY